MSIPDSKHINYRLIRWSKRSMVLCVNHNYSPLPHKLLECSFISPIARLVLMKLFKHFGKNENCYPTQPTIANDLGISQGTVSNAINELIEKRFISSTVTPFGNYIYKINCLENNPYILLSEARLYFLNNVKLIGVRKDRIFTKLKDSVKKSLSDDVVKKYAQSINDDADSSTEILRGFINMLLNVVKSDLGIDASIDFKAKLNENDEEISVSELIENEEYMKEIRRDIEAHCNGKIVEDGIDNWNALHFIELFNAIYTRELGSKYTGNKSKDLSAMCKVFDKFEDDKAALFNCIDLFVSSDTFQVKTIETFANNKIQSMLAFEMRKGFAPFDYEAVSFNRNFARNHPDLAMK